MLEFPRASVWLDKSSTSDESNRSSSPLVLQKSLCLNNSYYGDSFESSCYDYTTCDSSDDSLDNITILSQSPPKERGKFTVCDNLLDLLSSIKLCPKQSKNSFYNNMLVNTVSDTNEVVKCDSDEHESSQSADIGISFKYDTEEYETDHSVAAVGFKTTFKMKQETKDSKENSSPVFSFSAFNIKSRLEKKSLNSPQIFTTPSTVKCTSTDSVVPLTIPNKCEADESWTIQERPSSHKRKHSRKSSVKNALKRTPIHINKSEKDGRPASYLCGDKTVPVEKGHTAFTQETVSLQAEKDGELSINGQGHISTQDIKLLKSNEDKALSANVQEHISIQQNTVLLQPEDLSVGEKSWSIKYKNKLKDSSRHSSSSMLRFYDSPDNASTVGIRMFNSRSCENTRQKESCFTVELLQPHKRSYSATTCATLPAVGRTMRQRRLFKHQSQNNSPEPFTFLSERLPSYDISNFSGLNTGFVDTHCHLDFLFNRESFIGTFKEYKEKHSDNFPPCYEGCVAVFCDPMTFNEDCISEKLLEEDGIWAAFGCHPHNAKFFDSVTERALRKKLRHPRVVALGEIGLDYSSRNSCSPEIQHKVFRKQLQIAVEEDLPIVIHCRDAHVDCLRIMKEIVPLDHRIHRHCFTGDWKEAEIWLDTFPNLCLGITGLVTFSSAREVHDVVRKIPLNRLLLETDAPYFVPRHETLKYQKWSRPGMALHVAAQIAALRPEVTLENILKEVRKNTYRLYGC